MHARADTGRQPAQRAGTRSDGDHQTIETDLHIATGGDAALIARGVSEIDAVDPDITLDGLRQVAARVFQALP